MSVLKIVIGIAVGGLAGYLWHRLIGCRGGACPMVKSPYLSALWGALAGFMLSVQ